MKNEGKAFKNTSVSFSIHALDESLWATRIDTIFPSLFTTVLPFQMPGGYFSAFQQNLILST